MTVIRVVHLYHDVLNVYGDRGNVLALADRCRRRGIGMEVVPVGIGDPLDPADCDLVLVGGGQDGEQRRVADDISERSDGPNHAVEAGLPLLAVCGGFQMLGHRYIDHGGSILAGIGMFDLETRHPGPRADRCIGNVIVDTFLGEVVGFENHGGRTYLGPGQEPFGVVRKGFGNNAHDRTEGARHRNAIGTYLHGSVLPKNPAVADFLIGAALAWRTGSGVELAPLDDAVEMAAHARAIEVASR